MTTVELFRKIQDIVVWKRGDQRAPHKPLLILLAIKYLQRDGTRLIPYSECEEKLKELLKVFGPSRKSYHPEYPFWRLQNDDIWELKNAERVEARKSNTDAKKSELIKYDVSGGFKDGVYQIINSERNVRSRIIEMILNLHFPQTLHDDIIQHIGLEINENEFIASEKKWVNFRDLVLTSYKYKCAVCGFDLKYENKPIGLDAAHIRWQTQGGPSVVNNGLALCSQDRILFDKGAITVDKEYKLLVSELLTGSKIHTKRFLQSNKHINLPTKESDWPKMQFIDWHNKEVYKSPQC